MGLALRSWRTVDFRLPTLPDMVPIHYEDAAGYLLDRLLRGQPGGGHEPLGTRKKSGVTFIESGTIS